MRLLRDRKRAAGGAGDAIRAATAAGAEASERLASATEVHAAADRQAAGERGIVDDLRVLRERNHIAQLIVESLTQGKHPRPEAGDR